AKLRKQSSVNWGSLDDARALGTGHGKADTSRRLSFKNMGSGIANRMLSGDLGAKALAPSGAALVGQAFTQDPVALGRVATGLLDVLPVQVQTSPSYAYLAQTTRTNSAAVVAEGALKPVSVLGLTRVEKQLAVIAHVSESFNRMYLLDTNGAIEVFVNTELEWGLGRAVEAKVIADINATSGIQLQSYSTSPLQTLRKSITKLEIAGYAAGAIALHPSDFETIELQLSSVNSVERQGLPYDPARRTLYGVPVATTTSASAGIGHVLAAGAVVVDTDSQGVQFQWSENAGAETFQRNEIVARCEGRYGTSVLSPLGVVKATLTGGGGGGSTAA
ncbi:MAG: phage major capsid protein, partial [Thermoleophilia bacterium]